MLSSMLATLILIRPSFGCPVACSCQKPDFFLVVDCKGQGLSEIPDDIPDEVELLNLQDNAIENLDGLLNKNFRALQTLILNDNHIKNIDPLYKIDLPKLLVLQINNNNLTGFHTGILDSMPTVFDVGLRGNAIEKVHLDLTSYNFVSIHLEQNQISNMNITSIPGMPSSLRVYLNGNAINCCEFMGKYTLREINFIGECGLPQQYSGMSFSCFQKFPMRENVCDYRNLPLKLEISALQNDAVYQSNRNEELTIILFISLLLELMIL